MCLFYFLNTVTLFVFLIIFLVARHVWHNPIGPKTSSPSYQRVKLSVGNLINELQLGISIVRAFLHETRQTSTASRGNTSPGRCCWCLSTLLVFLVFFRVHSHFVASTIISPLSRGLLRINRWTAKRKVFCSAFVCLLSFPPQIQSGDLAFLFQRDYWSMEYYVKHYWINKLVSEVFWWKKRSEGRR